MKCPYCGHAEDRVVDSRTAKEGEAIRRRRQCLKCQKRYTTYEQIEESTPFIVKRDGRREQFDRRKIQLGVQKACEKRPVSVEDIERMVNAVERYVSECGKPEIRSSELGEQVMANLHELDQVAYVRFASVYRQFKDVNEFTQEIQRLAKNGKKKLTVNGARAGSRAR